MEQKRMFKRLLSILVVATMLFSSFAVLAVPAAAIEGFWSEEDAGLDANGNYHPTHAWGYTFNIAAVNPTEAVIEGNSIFTSFDAYTAYKGNAKYLAHAFFKPTGVENEYEVVREVDYFGKKMADIISEELVTAADFADGAILLIAQSSSSKPTYEKVVEGETVTTDAPGGWYPNWEGKVAIWGLGNTIGAKATLAGVDVAAGTGENGTLTIEDEPVEAITVNPVYNFKYAAESDVVTLTSWTMGDTLESILDKQYEWFNFAILAWDADASVYTVTDVKIGTNIKLTADPENGVDFGVLEIPEYGFILGAHEQATAAHAAIESLKAGDVVYIYGTDLTNATSETALTDAVVTTKAIDGKTAFAPEIAPAVELENLTQGNSYTTTLNYNATYPDTDNKEITDGILVEGETKYNDPRWAGFGLTKTIRSFDVVIPLGDGNAASDLYKIEANVGGDGIGAGITEPDLIAYYTVDGETWTEFGRYTRVGDADTKIVNVTIEADTPVKATQIKVNCGISIEGKNLLWIGEITAYGVKAEVAAPDYNKVTVNVTENAMLTDGKTGFSDNWGTVSGTDVLLIANKECTTKAMQVELLYALGETKKIDSLALDFYHCAGVMIGYPEGQILVEVSTDGETYNEVGKFDIAAAELSVGAYGTVTTLCEFDAVDAAYVKATFVVGSSTGVLGDTPSDGKIYWEFASLAEVTVGEAFVYPDGYTVVTGETGKWQADEGDFDYGYKYEVVEDNLVVNVIINDDLVDAGAEASTGNGVATNIRLWVNYGNAKWDRLYDAYLKGGAAAIFSKDAAGTIGTEGTIAYADGVFTYTIPLAELAGGNDQFQFTICVSNTDAEGKNNACLYAFCETFAWSAWDAANAHTIVVNKEPESTITQWAGGSDVDVMTDGYTGLDEVKGYEGNGDKLYGFSNSVLDETEYSFNITIDEAMFDTIVLYTLDYANGGVMLPSMVTFVIGEDTYYSYIEPNENGIATITAELGEIVTASEITVNVVMGASPYTFPVFNMFTELDVALLNPVSRWEAGAYSDVMTDGYTGLGEIKGYEGNADKLYGFSNAILEAAEYDFDIYFNGDIDFDTIVLYTLDYANGGVTLPEKVTFTVNGEEYEGVITANENGIATIKAELGKVVTAYAVTINVSMAASPYNFAIFNMFTELEVSVENPLPEGITQWAGGSPVDVLTDDYIGIDEVLKWEGNTDKLFGFGNAGLDAAEYRFDVAIAESTFNTIKLYTLDYAGGAVMLPEAVTFIVNGVYYEATITANENNIATIEATLDETVTASEITVKVAMGASPYEFGVFNMFTELDVSEVIYGTQDNPGIIEILQGFRGYMGEGLASLKGGEEYYWTMIVPVDGDINVQFYVIDDEYNNYAVEYSYNGGDLYNSYNYGNPALEDVKAGDVVTLYCKVAEDVPAVSVTAIVTLDAVGSMSNPESITEAGDITTEIAEGNFSGHTYSYVAPANGNLTVTMSDDNIGWMYAVSVVANNIYGDNHYSDDDPLVKSETIEVKEGDVVTIAISTYGGMSSAGTVKWTLAFEEVIPVTSKVVNGFNVGHYSEGSEGSNGAYIFTDAEVYAKGGFDWWRHVALAPVEGEEGLYKVVALTSGAGGTSGGLEIPEGGFIWVAFEWPETDESGKYALDVMNSIDVGSYVQFTGLDIANCTTTEDATAAKSDYVDPNAKENIALNKNYEISGIGNRDSYYGNITDGSAIMNLNGDNDKNWFGFYNNGDAPTNAPDKVGYFIIDLEKVYDVEGIKVGLIQQTGWGIAGPAGVKAYGSLDGETFEEIGTFEFSLENGVGIWTEISAEAQAQYIKIEVTLAGTFAFVNEVEVYGEEVVEQSTISPWGAGVEVMTDGYTGLGEIKGYEGNNDKIYGFGNSALDATEYEFVITIDETKFDGITLYALDYLSGCVTLPDAVTFVVNGESYEATITPNENGIATIAAEFEAITASEITVKVKMGASPYTFGIFNMYTELEVSEYVEKPVITPWGAGVEVMTDGYTGLGEITGYEGNNEKIYGFGNNLTVEAEYEFVITIDETKFDGITLYALDYLTGCVTLPDAVTFVVNGESYEATITPNENGIATIAAEFEAITASEITVKVKMGASPYTFGIFNMYTELEVAVVVPPVANLGDVNGDGEIDKFDYILVKRQIMNTIELTDEQLAVADVNGDGEIEKFDYILIKRHIMGTYEIKNDAE